MGAITERLADILRTYWIIWLILAGLVFYFLIWKKLDNYTKMKVSNFFSGTKLLIIFFIGGWLFWRWQWPDSLATIHISTFWMPMFLGIYLIAVLEIYQLRYETRQIVTPNFHGCFAKRDEVNGFYIYPIGSIMIFDVVLFTKKVLVIRKETAESLDWGGDVSIARPSPVNKYELDDDVKRFIEKTSYYPNKLGGKVFYGWFDSIDRVDWTEEQLEQLEKESKKTDLDKYKTEIKKLNNEQLISKTLNLKRLLKPITNMYLMLKQELGISNPSVIELMKMYKNLCMGKGKLKEEFHSTVEVVEEGAEHRQRVRDAYVDQEPQKQEEKYPE